MDGVERAVAVPAEKEAAREGGPELGGGQPGDGVDVVAADEAQKEGPHSPGISCPPPQIRLLLGGLLLPIRTRNFELGGAVGVGGSGRLGRGGIGGFRNLLSAAPAMVMPASHARFCRALLPTVRMGLRCVIVFR